MGGNWLGDKRYSGDRELENPLALHEQDKSVLDQHIQTAAARVWELAEELTEIDFDSIRPRTRRIAHERRRFGQQQRRLIRGGDVRRLADTHGLGSGAILYHHFIMPRRHKKSTNLGRRRAGLR